MSWLHIADTKPKARRTHTCGLCGEDILKGEKHIARRGFGDEGPTTFRMHPECERFTWKWDEMEWETHSEGDIKRPKTR